MSIDYSHPAATPPPEKLRILSIFIHNGTTERAVSPSGQEVATFKTAPFVELIIQGADYLKDSAGNPLPNPLGLSAYDDRAGYVTTLRISDAPSLLNFMAIWGQIMDGGEQLLADAIAAGRIRFSY